MADILDDRASSPTDDDPANKDLPKRCERCKRAKKGAQYCFDAGHHNGSVPLFPVIEPPPTKTKGKRSSGAGVGSTPPSKKRNTEGKGASNAAAKQQQDSSGTAQTSDAQNPEDGDGAEGDGDEGPKEEKEKTTKFDTNRRSRKWERQLMPVKIIGGEEILM
jgi:hypothetical protein